VPLKRRGARAGKGERAAEIVLPFVLVVAAMIALCVASMDIMSATRGFVGGENRWSQSQKIAASQLQHYLTSFSEADYQRYLEAVTVPLGDRSARLEMDKPDVDAAMVAAYFREGGIDDADIPGMSRLYRYFRHVGFIERAVAIWEESDKGIAELATVADEVHARVLNGERGGAWLGKARDRIRVIDIKLTPLEFAFSETLAEASRKTAEWLRLAIGLIGCLMVLGAAWRTRRLLDDRASVAHALRASEDRFQLAVAGANDGLWDWDRRSGKVYLSPRLQQMWGMEGERAHRSSESILLRLHPKDVRATMKAVVAHIRHATPLDIEFRVPMADGAMRWFRARGQSVRDGHGTSLRMAGSVTEVTERRAADALLFAEKERAQVTLQSIGDAVITTDAHGRIEYLNPVAERFTHWRAAAARGHPVQAICNIVDEETGDTIPDPVAQVLREHTGWTSGDKLNLLRSDGVPIAIDLTATPIRDRAGNMDGVVLVMRDVSSERQHAATLSYQASHDGLTGLINRREFERRLAQTVAAAERGGRPFTVLYVDLDQFKVVNDTCSHAAGDELLRQVAALFTLQVRHSDAVARLGGDEFVVLLNDCGPDDGMLVAENLRAAIGDLHFAHGDRTFSLSASIGLVSLRDEGLAREEILGAADAACHLAKEKGRNRVQSYRMNDEEVAVRQSEMCWVSRIQEALAAGRFVLYAQDILDLRGTGPSRHMELLLRMVAPDGELIPPRAFIPAAERYGLMPSIDRWVVQSAFATLRAAIDEDPLTAPNLCAINLSGTSLCDDGFDDFLRRQFIAFAIPASTICFEITETAAISSLSRAIAFITDMRELGCRFSLDDFGAGMSSFTYLKHLPVDFVKIDGSFVKDMDHDPIDHAMVQAINNIGHVTGKSTIAECVSCPGLLAMVRELGIDYAQGFAVAQPRLFTTRSVLV
jgi:diguanylate cyclase (GGDEF)-like protein/PAS domain S-box-containing protein